MWFIGVGVEQETTAPPPKKNPGSAPVLWGEGLTSFNKNNGFNFSCERKGKKHFQGCVFLSNTRRKKTLSQISSSSLNHKDSIVSDRRTSVL